jgi:hypothetical protein
MFEERHRDTRPPRQKIVTFHLDESELWQLRQAAKRADRSLSAYIRTALGRLIARDVGGVGGASR